MGLFDSFYSRQTEKIIYDPHKFHEPEKHLNEAREYVEENIIQLNMSLKDNCIDGRKPKHEKNLIKVSGPSFPAGSIGIDITAIAGMNDLVGNEDWDLIEILDQLIDMKGGWAKYGCHTLKKCAHWNSFIENPYLYNISEGQRNIMKSFYEKAEDLNPDELEGEHEEQFLLWVKSKYHTVRRRDKRRKQAFVFDEYASKYRLNLTIKELVKENISPTVTKKFIGKKYEHLALTTQQVTNKLLHLQKGLRIYEANIDDSGRLTHIQLSRTILSHSRQRT